MPTRQASLWPWDLNEDRNRMTDHLCTTLLRWRRRQVWRSSISTSSTPTSTFTIADLGLSILGFPKILPQILPAFLPYSAVITSFVAFVIWNGGIVLGKWYLSICEGGCLNPRFLAQVTSQIIYLLSTYPKSTISRPSLLSSDGLCCWATRLVRWVSRRMSSTECLEESSVFWLFFVMLILTFGVGEHWSLCL